MKLHSSITSKRVIDLVEDQFTSLNNPGICTACGEDAEDCEPDACGYECEYCGNFAVFGAEELLLSIGRNVK